MIRRQPEPPPATTDVRLARAVAAVDQALALADEALRAHRGNPVIVDFALDVKNALKAATRP